MAPNKDLTGHQLLYVHSEAQPAEWLSRLAQRFPGLSVVHYARDSWADASLSPDIRWGDVTVLLTGMLFPTRELAPRLELVQLSSAGANFLAKNPLFTETEIAFCTANGVHGPQIAEWVVSTFLAIQHHLPTYLDQQKEGKWKSNWGNPVRDSAGMRVGILGYGSIGRQVARVCKALGMDVIAYTNRPRNTPESRRDTGYTVPGLGDPLGEFPSEWHSGTDQSSIDAFLTARLDLLVLAVPLTPQTTRLIDARRLRLLSPSRTFVSNIGRGPVLDTDALCEALDEGWVRGAALDVTDPEPLPSGHPLWHKKNVIVTPHVSGNSVSYYARLREILEENLGRLAEGEGGFVNEVSRKRGY